jgi:hypothetical protein
MGSLELSLEVLVHGVDITHFIVNEVFVRDLERNQEFSSVCLTLEVGHARGQPPEDVLEGLLLSMDHISAEVGVEVSGVSEDLQKSTDSLFSLISSFLAGIDCFVNLVEITENFVNHLNQFHGRLIIEFDHTEVAHERRSVQHIHGILDLLSVESRSFRESLGLSTLRTSLIEHLVLTYTVDKVIAVYVMNSTYRSVGFAYCLENLN